MTSTPTFEAESSGKAVETPRVEMAFICSRAVWACACSSILPAIQSSQSDPASTMPLARPREIPTWVHDALGSSATIASDAIVAAQARDQIRKPPTASYDLRLTGENVVKDIGTSSTLSLYRHIIHSSFHCQRVVQNMRRWHFAALHGDIPNLDLQLLRQCPSPMERAPTSGQIGPPRIAKPPSLHGMLKGCTFGQSVAHLNCSHQPKVPEPEPAHGRYCYRTCTCVEKHLAWQATLLLLATDSQIRGRARILPRRSNMLPNQVKHENTSDTRHVRPAGPPRRSCPSGSPPKKTL